MLSLPSRNVIIGTLVETHLVGLQASAAIALHLVRMCAYAKFVCLRV